MRRLQSQLSLILLIALIGSYTARLVATPPPAVAATAPQAVTPVCQTQPDPGFRIFLPLIRSGTGTMTHTTAHPAPAAARGSAENVAAPIDGGCN
jgi:hypothetical protein